MKDNVFTGIVLKVSDYKENDKLAKIYTLEDGLISAVFKGVKKSGAKLRFFAQPFSFCNFEIISSNMSTVKTASIIEEFFSVCYDYERFSLASLLAEAVEKTALQESASDLFFLFIKSLKELVFSKKNAFLVATYFLSKYLYIGGYATLKPKPENPKTAANVINYLIHGDENFALEVSDSIAQKAFSLTLSAFERNFSVELLSKKALKFGSETT